MQNIIFQKDNAPVLGYNPEKKVFCILNYDLIPQDVHDNMWAATKNEVKPYMRESNNRRVVARWLSTVSSATRLDCDYFLDKCSSGDIDGLLSLNLSDGWKILLNDEELKSLIKY